MGVGLRDPSNIRLSYPWDWGAFFFGSGAAGGSWAAREVAEKLF